MKVTFILADLGAGGAQRVSSILLNGLVDRGYAVKVLCLSAQQESFFALNPSIDVEFLDLLQPSSGIFNAVWQNVRRVCLLRRAIKQNASRAVVSFVVETNILTILSSVGLGRRIIVSERSDPYYYPQNKYWRFMRRVTYPFASILVCQSRFAASYFCHRHSEIIPNPVVLRAATSVSPVPEGRRYGIAVGRLDPVKNYSLLVRSFVSLAKKHPLLDLVIVGEGSDRAAIEKEIHDCGLGARVYLLGAVADPQAMIAAADFFVLSSESEGMPNALLEAMMLGVPCVSTRCSPSIDEIISDGDQGLLVAVHNMDALTTAMDTLYTQEDVRQRLSDGARRDCARFAADAVLDEWVRVIS